MLVIIINMLTGLLKCFTHLRALLVLHDRGIFWPRQTSGAGQGEYLCLPRGIHNINNKHAYAGTTE
jgi:hypothetical protein